jgi:YHS domain-containing protein
LAICPVCGMTVDEKTAKWTSIYRGKTYYFCNPLDKEEFDSRPEKYTKSHG